MNRKTLTVYSASAGSGKTYSLVKEFLLLLFLNHYAPHSDLSGSREVTKSTGDPYFGFQGILGVTFTKKATLELKQRILRELIRLSEVKPGMVITGISKDVIKELSGLVGKTEQALSGELPCLSKNAVKQILEDYSHFNVRTIDSFFQEVLRGLRREITGQSFSGSYQIELNVKEAINLAIDNLKLEMDAHTYSNISSVVRRLQTDSIGKDERVDPFKEIADIAKHLINGNEWEEIKPKLLSEDVQMVVSQNQQCLKEVVNKYECKLSKAVEYGKRLIELRPNNLVSKVKSLSSIDELIKAFCNTDPEKRISKSLIKEWEINEETEERTVEISTLIGNVLNCFPDDKEVKEYITARLLLDYLDYIPILAEIAKSIEEYEHQNHLLLIPRVNQLLDQIIDGDDTPFVYDRVGVRLHHYVIDEFQDTAKLQWSNFHPLIKEARDSGHENFVVGDAKQSIYAFRGTDSSNFIKLVSYADSSTEVKFLPDNWRSDRRIVSFNNRFFTNIYDYQKWYNCSYTSDLTQLHREVYKNNVSQCMPKLKSENDGGYVEIAEIPKDGRKQINEGILMDYLQRCLTDLFSRGYKSGDIAILCRKNRECTKIAEWLTEWSSKDPRYAFISKRALELTSSPVVRLMRTLIKALSTPTSQSEKLLRLMILSYTLGSDPEGGERRAEELYDQIMSLPIAGLSVYEFILRAIDLLGEIPMGERLYANAFIDLAYTYSRRSPDLTIKQFDTWLDQRLDEMTVEMGNGDQDRINILTIHDAKGLEFPVVILPFAFWEIYTMRPINKDLHLIRIEGDATEQPSDLVPGIYLIDLSDRKRGLSSNLAHIYEHEREKVYMEELNLLYVAFTRAKSELYVLTKKEKSSSPRVSDIILNRLCDDKGDKNEEPILIQEERDGLTIWHSEKPHTERKADNEDSATGQAPLDSLVSIVDLKDLKVRDKYADERTDFGILMHSLLSSVYTADDFAPLLQNLLNTGRISKEDHDNLLANFTTAMKDPTYAEWFPPYGEAIIRTESTLYDQGYGREQRPDRVVLRRAGDGTLHGVVIDYKLGDPDPVPEAYRRQVKHYVNQLRSSGVDEVTGYLWYLRSPDGIIKVC